jgi:hypothetical protein
MNNNEYIARHIMGWNQWDGKDDYNGEYPMFCMRIEEITEVYKDGGEPDFYFAPDFDANDFDLVMQKVMKNKPLFIAYTDFLAKQFINEDRDEKENGFMRYARTTLKQRCQALVDAHKSLAQSTNE